MGNTRERVQAFGNKSCQVMLMGVEGCERVNAAILTVVRGYLLMKVEDCCGMKVAAGGYTEVALVLFENCH